MVVKFHISKSKLLFYSLSAVAVESDAETGLMTEEESEQEEDEEEEDFGYDDDNRVPDEPIYENIPVSQKHVEFEDNQEW